jgi:hypothetical protein
MLPEQQERSVGRRLEDCDPHKCTKGDLLTQIVKCQEETSKQLEAIESTNEQNGKTLDAIATAFVDKDYVRHRTMQKAEIDAEDDAKALRRHVKHGLALAGSVMIAGFILMAVWTRIVTVSVPQAQTQGVGK